MRRVLIIGSGGAGKTTLAKAVAERTGLPLVHLDKLFWRAGWVPAPNDEWDRVIAELSGRDRWIQDGNYGRTLPTRLAAADTVIFLDVPALVCLWRVFKRQLRHIGRVRPELPEGCRERLTFEFVAWIWTYRTRRRPEILRRLAEYQGTKRVVVLRTARDVRAFLRGLGDGAAREPAGPGTDT